MFAQYKHARSLVLGLFAVLFVAVDGLTFILAGNEQKPIANDVIPPAPTNRPMRAENSDSPRATFGPLSEQICTNTVGLEFISRPAVLSTNYPKEEFGPLGDLVYEAGDGLFTADMKLLKLAPGDWAGLTANQLKADLAAEVSDPTRPLIQPEVNNSVLYGWQTYTKTVRLKYSESKTPTMYGFQTRRGLMGMLEVFSVTNKPSGVRIRYKVVQNGEDAFF
jgi:hypothetical protein